MLTKMVSSHALPLLMVVLSIGAVIVVYYFINKNEKDIKKDK